MKKNFVFLLAGFFPVLSIFYLACSKGKAKETTQENISLQTGKKLNITVDQSALGELLDPGDGGGGEGDVCLHHGGTIGIGSSWELATCRSNCTTGIGFRCGRELYIICADGTHIPLNINTGNCPPHGSNTPRQMDGTIYFYENNTMKVLFNTSVTSEENDNNTFEVEQDDIIDLPEYLLLGEVHYSKIKILQNNYQLNRNDGSYGSAVFSIQYIQ